MRLDEQLFGRRLDEQTTPAFQRIPNHQAQRLSILFKRALPGASREERLHAASVLVGRPVSSLGDIMAHEANVLFEHLELQLGRNPAEIYLR